MLQITTFVVKNFIIYVSMLNMLCLYHCCLRFRPQYAVHASPAFLVVNIEYLTIETPVSSKNIL